MEIKFNEQPIRIILISNWTFIALNLPKQKDSKVQQTKSSQENFCIQGHKKGQAVHIYVCLCVHVYMSFTIYICILKSFYHPCHYICVGAGNLFVFTNIRSLDPSALTSVCHCKKKCVHVPNCKKLMKAFISLIEGE